MDELIAVGNQFLVFETNNLVGTQTKISLDEFLDKLYKKIYSGCIEYNKNILQEVKRLRNQLIVKLNKTN